MMTASQPSNDRRGGPGPEILAIIAELSTQERAVLSEILKIEQENLHLDRPKVKSEILEQIRRIVK